MTENFFTDNLDMQFHLDKIDLREIVAIRERDYAMHDQYPAAPRSYEDAKDNYRLLLELLGDICANHIAPRAAEADEEEAQYADGKVTYAAATQDALDLMRQADLMGVMLPYQYGGLNLPETIYQMMIEIVSRAEAGLMTIFGLQEISATIAEYGDEEMKERVLPRFARGEVLGAMVLTEPDAGSDLGAVQTRATWDEEAQVWRLNGVKRFITNGCAEGLLVLARSEEDSHDARGLSFFEVEADETVRVRRIENKLGIHSSPTCEMQFTNTPARLVGKRRFGLVRYAMAMMNGARIAVASQGLGIAEAAYREAYKYAQERAQFGQEIMDFPAVYRMLLTMRTEIEATRALIYETGRWVDLNKAYDHLKNEGELDREGRKHLKAASRLMGVLTPLAKYYATEMANRVAYDAIQIHGGTGYMREFNAERHYRDARITNIYEGTSQLQVVAAIGGILGHALDLLLDDWTTQAYGDALADLKATMDEATAVFERSIDHLKEYKEDRELIDYYASDLVDMAVIVVNSWLLLQDAQVDERKRDVARIYILEKMPQFHSKAKLLQLIDPAPLKAKDSVLTAEV